MKYWLLFLGLVVILATGCDQKPPTIATPLTPSTTFNLSGKVYELNYLSNSADLAKPLEGATITAVGTNAVTTQTSSTGAYSFVNLPLAEYSLTVSKEGYQKDGKTTLTATYNFSSSSMANTAQIVDFSLDPRPLFLCASVPDYAEIPASTRTFKLFFSEAMSPESITAFVKMLSLRSSDISSLGIQDTNLSWEAGYKTLQVNLVGNLTADALYQIGLACSNSEFGIEGVCDARGNRIYGTLPADNDVYNSSVDARYGAYIYAPFKTESNKTAAPGKPNGLAVRSLATGSTEVDYDGVYSSAGGVTLTFNSVAEANGYRLYVSSNNSDYSLCKEFSTPSVVATVYDLVTALGSSIARGYDTYGYPIEPGLPWPYLGSGDYFKVTAYNSKGESPFSDPLLVVDTVAPSLAAVSTAYPNNCISESPTVKILRFTEPLNRSTAENIKNYLVTPEVTTVESASLINDYGYSYSPYRTTYVRLFLTLADTGPRKVRVWGMKDLTGNTMRATLETGY